MREIDFEKGREGGVEKGGKKRSPVDERNVCFEGQRFIRKSYPRKNDYSYSGKIDLDYTCSISTHASSWTDKVREQRVIVG